MSKSVFRFDLEADAGTAGRLFKALALFKVSLRDWAQGVFAAGLSFLGGATRDKGREAPALRVTSARRLPPAERDEDGAAVPAGSPSPYDGGGLGGDAAFLPDPERDAAALAETRAALRLDPEAVALLALFASETGRAPAELVRAALGAGLRKALAPRVAGSGRADESPAEYGRDACFVALNRAQGLVRNPLDCAQETRAALAAFWLAAPPEVRARKGCGAALAPVPERPALPAGSVVAVADVARLGRFKSVQQLRDWRKKHGGGGLVPVPSKGNPRHFAGFTAESVSAFLARRFGAAPSLPGFGPDEGGGADGASGAQAEGGAE